MDIRAQLLQEHSKENSQKIAAYIGSDANKYRELWSLVASGEKVVAQRAAWVLDHSTFSYSKGVLPFLPEMIAQLQKPGHEAIKRNVLKILAGAEAIPEDLSGPLFDLCIDWMINKKTAIAVKVHAMEVATKIAMPYPELREEVKVVIEEQMKYGSAGIRSRGRRLLKQLEEKK